MRSFFAEIDTVLMGNKTYQQILGFGEYPYKGKKGFVFSQILQGKKDNNVEFVGGDLKSFINRLRQSSGGDIWERWGSADNSLFPKTRFYR